MQIKRFKAQDMGAALAMIKKEFGSDAVILSARDIHQPSRVLGMPRACAVEVTAAIDAEVKTGGQVAPDLAAGSRGGRIEAVQDTVRLKPEKRLMRTLRTGMNVFRKRGETMAGKERRTGPAADGKDLHHHLVSQGISSNAAARLVDRARSYNRGNGSQQPAAWRGGLVRALELSGLKTGAGTHPSGKRCVALVGPTGTGKTTVLAKLAAAAPGRVGVVTLDQQRIGAMAQLQVYAKIMGWPLEMAADGEELRIALDRLADKELILVDTPGLSPSSAYQIHALKGVLAAAPVLETLLVVSATTKDDDLARVRRRFLPLGVNRLVFTRLDESRTIGNLINLALESGIPVAYLTDGVRVPEDIEPATVDRLADLILTPSGGRQPRSLRGQGVRPNRKEEKARPRERASRTASPVPGQTCAVQSSASRKEEKARPREHSSGTASPASAPTCAVQFVANQNSDIFHRPDCKWTRMIKKENMVVFQSVEEARQRKFSPCRYCSPVTVEAFRPMAHHTLKRRVGGRG